MKKYFTRLEIQNILDTNHLGAKVSYEDREDIGSPDNVIIYDRIPNNISLFADDKIHMKKVFILVSHYHKRKLDNIEQLMIDNFNCESGDFGIKQLDTDYYCDYYRFEVFSDTRW